MYIYIKVSFIIFGATGVIARQRGATILKIKPFVSVPLINRWYQAPCSERHYPATAETDGLDVSQSSRKSRNVQQTLYVFRIIVYQNHGNRGVHRTMQRSCFYVDGGWGRDFLFRRRLTSGFPSDPACFFSLLFFVFFFLFAAYVIYFRTFAVPYGNDSTQIFYFRRIKSICRRTYKENKKRDPSDIRLTFSLC